MTNSILTLLPVKGNSAATLYLHEGKPALELDGQTAWVPDSILGRWYLRAYFPHMKASPEAKAWYSAQNPMHKVQEHIVEQMVKSPKPYQRIACARLLIDNSALWLDMGLGKTYISLLYFLHRYHEGCRTFLVVCPTTVFTSWILEAEELYGQNVPHQVVLAHGPKKQKLLTNLRFNPPNNLTIIVTSYESLASVYGHLKELPISATIFDEASKIKSYTAKRSKDALRLARAKPEMACHLLSGTPSTKSVEGFYPLYELLGAGRSGSPDYVTFCKTYLQQITLSRCITSDGHTVFIRAEKFSDYERWMNTNCPPGSNTSYRHQGYVLDTHNRYANSTKHIKIKNTFAKTVGAKNLEKLRLVTLSNAYCLKKENVALDLPEKMHIIREVPMSAEITAAYKKFIIDNIVELNSTRFSFSNASSPHVKLHQICNGFFYDTGHVPHYFESQPKIDELMEILNEAGSQKIVIWSPFRPQIARVAQALKENEIEHVILHGDVAPADRPKIINKFRREPDIRCLIANPEVAGMGLTLVESHLAVVMTNWFKPDTRSQLIDRLHRIGQTEPVTVIDLVTPQTLEGRILHSLKNDIEIEGQLITGASPQEKAHDKQPRSPGFTAGTGTAHRRPRQPEKTP